MDLIGAQLRRPRIAAALVLVLAIAGLVAVLGADALFIAPALAAALMLGLRQYPGEHLIATLRRAPGPTAARCPALLGTARAGHDVLPGGGLLLALSLAVRPPPRLTAA